MGTFLRNLIFPTVVFVGSRQDTSCDNGVPHVSLDFHSPRGSNSHMSSAGISPLMDVGDGFKRAESEQFEKRPTNPLKLTCPLKRDHFLKEISSSNHHFSGDVLVFRGGNMGYQKNIYT